MTKFRRRNGAPSWLGGKNALPGMNATPSLQASGSSFSADNPSGSCIQANRPPLERIKLHRCRHVSIDGLKQRLHLFDLQAAIVHQRASIVSISCHFGREPSQPDALRIADKFALFKFRERKIRMPKLFSRFYPSFPSLSFPSTPLPLRLLR